VFVAAPEPFGARIVRAQLGFRLLGGSRISMFRSYCRFIVDGVVWSILGADAWLARFFGGKNLLNVLSVALDTSSVSHRPVGVA
jgi:hypothetical protein